MDSKTIRQYQRQREQALDRIGVGRHARRPGRAYRITFRLLAGLLAITTALLGLAIALTFVLRPAGAVPTSPGVCVTTTTTTTTLNPPRQPGEYVPVPAGGDWRDC
jgi:hypothetical protein